MSCSRVVPVDELLFDDVDAAFDFAGSEPFVFFVATIVPFVGLGKKSPMESKARRFCSANARCWQRAVQAQFQCQRQPRQRAPEFRRSSLRELK